MDLMLVLAPYNQAIVDLVHQSGNVVALRITSEGDLPPEEMAEVANILTEAGTRIEALGGDITADQAATQAADGTEVVAVLGAPETLEEEVYRSVWRLVLSAVRERSQDHKRSLMIEPFANVPGKLHPAAVEDVVLEKLEKNLRDRQYKDIEWDRRDGRVVLTFGW